MGIRSGIDRFLESMLPPTKRHIVYRKVDSIEEKEDNIKAYHKLMKDLVAFCNNKRAFIDVLYDFSKENKRKLKQAKKEAFEVYAELLSFKNIIISFNMKVESDSLLLWLHKHFKPNYIKLKWNENLRNQLEREVEFTFKELCTFTILFNQHFNEAYDESKYYTNLLTFRSFRKKERHEQNDIEIRKTKENFEVLMKDLVQVCEVRYFFLHALINKRKNIGHWTHKIIGTIEELNSYPLSTYDAHGIREVIVYLNYLRNLSPKDIIGKSEKVNGVIKNVKKSFDELEKFVKKFTQKFNETYDTHYNYSKDLKRFHHIKVHHSQTNREKQETVEDFKKMMTDLKKICESEVFDKEMIQSSEDELSNVNNLIHDTFQEVHRYSKTNFNSEYIHHIANVLKSLYRQISKLAIYLKEHKTDKYISQIQSMKEARSFLIDRVKEFNLNFNKIYGLDEVYLK